MYPALSLACPPSSTPRTVNSFDLINPPIDLIHSLRRTSPPPLLFGACPSLQHPQQPSDKLSHFPYSSPTRARPSHPQITHRFLYSRLGSRQSRPRSQHTFPLSRALISGLFIRPVEADLLCIRHSSPSSPSRHNLNTPARAVSQILPPTSCPETALVPLLT